MKMCKHCEENKELSEYYKNKALKDGHENICKICRQIQRKKHFKKCEHCDSGFKTAYKNVKYCSQKCTPQSQRDRVKVNCFICNEEKEITHSRASNYKHFYCSDICKREGYGVLYSGKDHARYNSIEIYCDECDKTFSRWASQIMKAEKSYCSKECQAVAFRVRFAGKLNPSWNPKRTEEERVTNRNIEGYNEWRTLTFARDGYKCMCCGDARGGNLVAHHIKNYSEFKELRVCLSNSITMCLKCHKAFHDTHGYTGNNRRQLNAFLADNEQIS